jgi:hypothetical protein
MTQRKTGLRRALIMATMVVVSSMILPSDMEG